MAEDLKTTITGLIYEADWYFRCSGVQNEHHSDLELIILEMNNEDEVVNAIIDAVLLGLGDSA